RFAGRFPKGLRPGWALVRPAPGGRGAAPPSRGRGATAARIVCPSIETGGCRSCPEDLQRCHRCFGRSALSGSGRSPYSVATWSRTCPARIPVPPARFVPALARPRGEGEAPGRKGTAKHAYLHKEQAEATPEVALRRR